MEITLDFHVEASEGAIVWWVESDDLPGVSAAADSLSELRELITPLLADLSAERGENIVVASERLAGEVEEPTEVPPRSIDPQRSSDEPVVSSAAPVRRVLVSV